MNKFVITFVILSKDEAELISLHPSLNEAIAMQRQILFDLQKETVLRRRRSSSKYRFVKPKYKFCFDNSQVTFEDLFSAIKGGKK